MIAASLLLATSVSFAQVVEEIEIEKLQTNKVVSSNFWDNWFISVGAGVTSNYITNNNYSNLGDNVSFAFDASLGKWFSPIFGGRIQYRGFESVTNPSATQEYSWTPFNLHADFLINAMNLFGEYREDRVYDLIPFAGAGYMGYSDSNEAANELFLTGGLINRFRISKAFDINLELAASTVSARAVPTVQTVGYLFVPLSATVGVTYNFGKDYGRDFERVQTVVDEAVLPYEEAIGGLMLANGELADEAEMLAMNNEELKDKVAELEKRLANQKPVATPTANVIYTALFKIDSYKIAREDSERLEMLAEEIKSIGGKYVIEGYADSATGTESWNQTLSDNRAKAIYDVLVNKYGVNPNSIKAVGMGATDIYKQIELNRNVLVRVVE